MSDDERIEGPHCYGASDDPHTPVRTVYLSHEELFRCPLCGREADPDDLAEELATEAREKAFEEAGEDEQQGLAAAVELLTGADERVDLYGLNELEADLYLSTHYSQVVAHDTLRLSILVPMIKEGVAEEITGGYVQLSDEALRALRKMARWRNWSLLHSFRPHRQFAKSLLHEWTDAGKVRLSVLASIPRTLVAEDYQGRPTGAVSWDAEGKATISLGADADPGTFITSAALFFRRTLSPEQQRAAERAFGIRDGSWRPEDEQRYARAYLRWVSEGNAPIPELREAFEVFNRIATPEMLDVELTDEMRAVFRTTVA